MSYGQHQSNSSLRTLMGTWRRIWKRSLSKYPDPVRDDAQPRAMARRLRRA